MQYNGHHGCRTYVAYVAIHLAYHRALGDIRIEKRHVPQSSKPRMGSMPVGTVEGHIRQSSH